MILVIGGTGLVGAKLVELLLDAQQPVRVYARGYSDWRDNIMPAFRKAGVDIVSADVRDEKKMSAALNGVTCIVHCAAIMRDNNDETMEDVNVRSLEMLLPLAQQAGVQRLLFVGCLGATQFNSSAYFQTKWQAEQLIKQSSFYWTIFRPSLIFGAGSHLVRSLEFWVSRFPFIPVVGSGLNTIQAISADDVADCLMQSIYNRDTVNKTYDLVGPEEYTLTDLMEMTAVEYVGTEKPLFKLPAGLGYSLANLLSKLNPRTPVTADFMRVLTSDLAANPALMHDTFKVKGIPLDSFYKRLPARR